MGAPVRIQLSRKKGWRKPENTVVVSRPSKWGNPFRLGHNVCFGSGDTFRCEKVVTRADAVAAFTGMLAIPFRAYPAGGEIELHLRGKNLACWCPLDQPCHADVLLEMANATPQPTGGR